MKRIFLEKILHSFRAHILGRFKSSTFLSLSDLYHAAVLVAHNNTQNIIILKNIQYKYSTISTIPGIRPYRPSGITLFSTFSKRQMGSHSREPDPSQKNVSRLQPLQPPKTGTTNSFWLLNQSGQTDSSGERQPCR